MNMYNPAHPGELILETIKGIREETNSNLTMQQVAKGLKTSRKTLSAIINGRQAITSEMALKLAKAFNTSAEVWVNMQTNYDLSQAKRKTNVREVKVFWKRKIVA